MSNAIKMSLGIIGMIIFIGLVKTMNIDTIDGFASAIIVLVGIVGATTFVNGWMENPSQSTERKI